VTMRATPHLLTERRAEAEGSRPSMRRDLVPPARNLAKGLELWHPLRRDRSDTVGEPSPSGPASGAACPHARTTAGSRGAAALRNHRTARSTAGTGAAFDGRWGWPRGHRQAGGSPPTHGDRVAAPFQEGCQSPGHAGGRPALGTPALSLSDADAT